MEGWGDENTLTSVRYYVSGGIFGWWFSFKYFHTLLCLIKDLPNVQELRGKGRDHIRGSDAIFSSILYSRLTRFLSIPSGPSFIQMDHGQTYILVILQDYI